VALAAVKRDRTIAELASEFGKHQVASVPFPIGNVRIGSTASCELRLLATARRECIEK
jgi:hypothetical protein